MVGIRNLIRRFIGEEKGAIAIWAGLSIPMIFGIGALAFDMNSMYTTKAQLQHTADAAAMAAAQALPDATAATTAAQNYANLNMPSVDHGTVVATNDVVPGNWDASGRVFTPSGSPVNAVRVIARRATQNGNAMPTAIASVLGISSVDVSASSVVALGAGGAGNACIISLNMTASQAFYLQGNGSVKTVGCDVFVNSCNQTDALKGQGNTYIELDAETVGAKTGKIYVCGEVLEQGPAYFYPDPEHPYKLNEENYAADPFGNTFNLPGPPPSFADLYDDDATDCDAGHTNFSSTASNITLDPGVWCGGITLTGGGSVTFNPGLYIIKNGELSVSGDKTIEGVGVTFFMTGANANIDFQGTADIHLSASPVDLQGLPAGFIFFGDRDNPATNPHLMRGTPMGGYDGAIYLPKAKVLMQGTAGVLSGYSSDCTMIVADKLEFLGTPNFEAERSGCTSIGGGSGASVKLVGQ